MKYAIFALLLFCAAGCGKETDGTGEPVAASPSATADGSPNVVAPSETQGQSPAFQQPILPVDSHPEDVVAAFLNAWKAGDNDTQTGLLTAKARAVFAELNFVMGNGLPPNTKIEIKGTEFGSELKDIAYVHVVLTIHGADAGPDTEKASWILKKQDLVGWRIAGMGPTEAGIDQLTSFESKEAMELQFQGSSQTRQAARPADAGSLKR